MAKRMRQRMLQAGFFAAVSAVCTNALAIEFTIPLGEEGIKAVLNNTASLGAQWRMQERSETLVGKGNLNPNVCGRGADGRPLYQLCQGLFKDQVYPAQHLAAAPGAFSSNGDDGNLNYDRHDLTQAPFKLTQDLSMTWGEFGFFARTLYFYDIVNNNFTEKHPNRVTNENFFEAGTPVTALNNNGFPRNDSFPCGSRNPTPGAPCGLLYSKGLSTRNTRRSETLRQIGQNFQLLDAVVYGHVNLAGKDLTVKLGRQTINWGESTLLVINSINQAQPINANNFLRTGFQVEEVFTPQASLYVSAPVVENLNLEAFYQFQWEPIEIPADGSFFSFADLGTHNDGDSVTIGFGNGFEDQDAAAGLGDNPLTGLTNTSGKLRRLPDNEPKGFGLTNQYGAALKYNAEWLNNGTELGLYFMNYHSKLPYISAYAAVDSCARDSRNSLQFLMDCPDIPLLHAVRVPNDPKGATSSALPLDSAKIQLEYPENIKLLGLSFTTTVGPISLQGEVAYRPNMPLQVDTQDVLFAALGPTLTRCHNPDITASRPDRPGPCAGTGNLLGTVTQPVLAALPPALASALGPVLQSAAANGGPLGGVGTDANGNVITYGSSDYVVDAAGTKGAFKDTFDLLVGDATGSARSFPNFIIPYRGGVVGENPGSDPTRPYDHRNPGYIRGYERLGVYQFNIGATHILGATDRLNVLNADQIITLFEVGATYVPDLPPLDVLQFEAPGTDTPASAGADGSGANRSRQACSTVVTCSYGPDGLRFNPHQADLSLYPDKFSWGYRVIMLIKYESVLPSISLQPMIIWQHDVHGTAPAPLDINFTDGRKTATLNFEMRYKSALSLTPGYTWFTGADGANNLKDRDFAQIYLKYQF